MLFLYPNVRARWAAAAKTKLHRLLGPRLNLNNSLWYLTHPFPEVHRGVKAPSGDAIFDLRRTRFELQQFKWNLKANMPSVDDWSIRPSEMWQAYCRVYSTLRRIAENACSNTKSKQTWFDGEPSIAMLLSPENVCDLDLWTHDLEHLISSWPNCTKYLWNLCKFWLKSL